MNMGLTLAVYAAHLPRAGPPFVFPGSETQWNGAHRHDRRRPARRADGLGRHDTRRGRRPAFNIVNGDVFRWRWLWPRLAEHLGVEPEGFDDAPASARAADGRRRRRSGRELAEREGLARADLDAGRLLVAHRRRPRPRHRVLHRHEPAAATRGSPATARTLTCFLDLFDQLETDRVVPAPG